MAPGRCRACQRIARDADGRGGAVAGRSGEPAVMLYHLLYPLHASYTVFNVFRYQTFRALIAALTALLISFLLGPWLIRSLTARQIGQTIRPDGPQSHFSKAGTPTMGGTLILFSLILATLL